MADSDGFITVRSRKKGTQQKVLPSSAIDTDAPSLPYSKLLRSVATLRVKLNTEAVQSVAATLSTACYSAPRTSPPNTPDSSGSTSPSSGTESSLNINTDTADDLSSVRCIVCYGLGSPCSNRNSRAQTALLLHLQQLCPAASVLLYDPVFRPDDEKLFASYEFKVESCNEECARHTKGQRTLFYMPHCSWEMYNNLLWANWSAEDLSNVIVIGNDVRDLDSFLPNSRFRSKYSYLHSSLRQGLAELWRLPALTSQNTEFIGSAVMWFPKTRLQQQVEALWADCTKPEYGEECVELIKANKPSQTVDSVDKCLQKLKL